MRKKSKKEKHIGEGKTFSAKSIGLVPNISYNDFFIWDDITKYMHLPHEFIQGKMRMSMMIIIFQKQN